jgi:hypothetical protein
MDRRARFVLIVSVLVLIVATAAFVWRWARPSVTSIDATPSVLSATHPTCTHITVKAWDPLHLVRRLTVSAHPLPESTALSRTAYDRFEADMCPKNPSIGILNLELSMSIWLWPMTASIKARAVQLVITNMDINLSKPRDLEVSTWMNEGRTVIFSNIPSTMSGGMYPPEGTVEIDVSSLEAPARSIDEYVQWNLRDTQLISERDVTVSGIAGKELIYTRTPDSGVVLRESFVYFVSGATLFKCFMTFHAGDKGEQEYVKQFNQTINSIYVPQ